MCVNDLIVQGAKPLIFLDYISINKINLKKLKLILKGIVKGCKISQCELVGGETAEMPGTYEKGKFDIAGFSVGVVDQNKILDKKKIKINNLILAIPSSGIHSNGYSLIRCILNKKKINELISPITESIGIERATPSLLSRMLKSTMGFSDLIEDNSHSKIISQKYRYMIENSLFSDCYFYLGYINRNNFKKIQDLHRKPELIHILKTGFDLESDTTKIESEATKLHESTNYLLSLYHE